MDIRSGPRMANIIVSGHRKVAFKDGQVIHCSLTQHKLWNIIFGNLSWQVIGQWNLVDEANGLKAYIKFNAFKEKK